MLPCEPAEKTAIEVPINVVTEQNGRTAHLQDALETTAVEIKAQRLYDNEHSRNSLGTPL
jgi:hypothetical protein